MAKKESEQQVLNAILEFLEYSGFYCVRINSGGIKVATHFIRLGRRGTPDIISCVKGDLIAFEVKKNEKEVAAWLRKVDLFRKTAVLNPNCAREIDQYKEMEKIKKSGGKAFLVCSVEEVAEILDKISADDGYNCNY